MRPLQRKTTQDVSGAADPIFTPVSGLTTARSGRGIGSTGRPAFRACPHAAAAAALRGKPIAVTVVVIDHGQLGRIPHASDSTGPKSGAPGASRGLVRRRARRDARSRRTHRAGADPGGRRVHRRAGGTRAAGLRGAVRALSRRRARGQHRPAAGRRRLPLDLGRAPAAGSGRQDPLHHAARGAGAAVPAGVHRPDGLRPPGRRIPGRRGRAGRRHARRDRRSRHRRAQRRPRPAATWPSPRSPISPS